MLGTTLLAIFLVFIVAVVVWNPPKKLDADHIQKVLKNNFKKMTEHMKLQFNTARHYTADKFASHKDESYIEVKDDPHPQPDERWLIMLHDVHKKLAEETATDVNNVNRLRRRSRAARIIRSGYRIAGGMYMIACGHRSNWNDLLMTIQEEGVHLKKGDSIHDVIIRAVDADSLYNSILRETRMYKAREFMQ